MPNEQKALTPTIASALASNHMREYFQYHSKYKIPTTLPPKDCPQLYVIDEEGNTSYTEMAQEKFDEYYGYYTNISTK